MSKCRVYVAGRDFLCRSSYTEIRDAIEEGRMKVEEGEIAWMPPIEVITGLRSEPARLLLQPHAIAAVEEIP